MKIFSAVFLAFVISSCTLMRVIDVPDYHADSRENLQSVSKGLGIISHDLAGLNAINSKWSDAESKSRLAKLNQAHQNLQQLYVRTKEDLESSRYKSKKKVTSEDKDYEAVKKERDDFQTRFDNLETQLTNYKKERNALKEYLESKGIYRVDANKINGDFIQALNESKKTQLQVKNELMDYNVQLNQSTASPEETKKNKSIIQELVKVVEQIENETFKLQRQHSVLAKEVGQAVVFVTPGMKAHGYVEKIKLHSETVEKLVDQFNELAKTLK